MKKNILRFGMALMLTGISMALPAQPPPPGSGHGSTEPEVPAGGTTPLGSCSLLLLSLGAAYGAKKTYSVNKTGRKKPDSRINLKF